MRRRILAAILGVVLLAVALFAVPLGVVLQRFADEQATLKLERSAVATARQIPRDLAASGDNLELPTSEGIKFGLYDSSGTLVAGTGPHHGDEVVNAALHDRVIQREVAEGRATAIPVGSDEKVIGALRAAQPTSVTESQTDRINYLLVALAAAVLLIGAIVGRVVAGRLVRPVARLRDNAVRLGGGDFRVRSAPSGVRELDDAGEALSLTAQRLDDLVSRERAFSADASHQLRTPLAALRVSVETELAFPCGDPTQVLRDVLDDVNRLESTIDDLLSYARTSAMDPRRIDVVSLLDQVQARWNGPLALEGRRLVVHVAGEVPAVVGVEPLLHQALDCLVDNALRHGAGEVALTVRITDESVTISICDEGTGFADEASPDDGSPHGFGIPLARRLIEANRGRLVFANSGPCPIVDVVLLRPTVDGW